MSFSLNLKFISTLFSVFLSVQKASPRKAHLDTFSVIVAKELKSKIMSAKDRSFHIYHVQSPIIFPKISKNFLNITKQFAKYLEKPSQCFLFSFKKHNEFESPEVKYLYKNFSSNSGGLRKKIQAPPM